MRLKRNLVALGYRQPDQRKFRRRYCCCSHFALSRGVTNLHLINLQRISNQRLAILDLWLLYIVLLLIGI